MMNTRTSNSFRNISAGFISQITGMVLGFISRTVFIKYLSAEYLGVSSLFSNILSMLALAELGLASAFIYELYKPLSKNDHVNTAVILRYFKKAYAVVGIVVILTGIILIPFLPDIIAEKPKTIVEDIRIIFFFYIISSASSYFFSYKTALLDADQKVSVTTLTFTKFSVGQNLVQILVLILTKNFLIYLSVQIISQLLANIYLSGLVDKKYPFLKQYAKMPLDLEVKKNIIGNVKATFLTKIGGVLVNATDNIFISMFVGLALLGKYSNYVLLFTLVSGFLMIIFANIKSSVAHFVINENLERQREMFKTINFFNFICFGLASLIIYFCINDFIEIWIGKSYVLAWYIPFILAVNFFMVGMQNGFWTFKGAYGYFRYGKYMVLGTAAINLVLSYFLGKHFGIAGIITATAIARLFTNFWYDPYIVLKKGLKQNPIVYLKRFSLYLLILSITAAVTHFLFTKIHVQLIIQIFLKVLIIIPCSFLLIYLFLGKNTELHNAINILRNLPLIKKVKWIQKI